MEGHLTEYPQDPWKAWHPEWSWCNVWELFWLKPGFPKWSCLYDNLLKVRHHSTSFLIHIFSIVSTLMEFTLGAPNCLLEKLIVMFRKRLRHLIQIRSLVDLHRSVVMYHRRIQGEVGRSRFRCLSPVGTSVLRRLRFHATMLSWTVGSIILLSSIGGHDRLHHCSLQSTCCTCTGAGNLRGVAIKPGYLGCPMGVPKVRGVPGAKATWQCCCWKTDDISCAT